MTQAVANRYVTALADVVTEPGSALTPERTLEQLEAFGDVLAKSPELDSVLRSPAVSPREKRELVSAIGQRLGMDRVVRNFLCVVVDQRRIGHFNLLLDGFRTWLDQLRNRVKIEVRAAGRLRDGHRASLERQFERLTGMQVRPTYVVDPGLLGGMSVQIGSILYDGSLRKSLGSLASSLASGEI